MIDIQLSEELEYKDFYPIFSDIEKCMRRLDALEIRCVVGDRAVDVFEDKFIRLIMATFKALEK